MKCNDCGKPDYTPSNSRGDVCVDCMELRGQLIKAVATGGITPAEFARIQKKLRGRSHNGAAAILQSLGLGPKHRIIERPEPIDDAGPGFVAGSLKDYIQQTGDMSFHES